MFPSTHPASYTLLRASIPREDIEKFIDERFEAMLKRPLMYGGDAHGVEMIALTFCEIFSRFCLKGDLSGPWSRPYLAFRKKDIPSCPGPMSTAQWFTDLKYGDPTMRDVPAKKRGHEAGVRIMTHLIAFKAHLKAHVPTKQTSAATEVLRKLSPEQIEALRSAQRYGADYGSNSPYARTASELGDLKLLTKEMPYAAGLSEKRDITKLGYAVLKLLDETK